MITDLPIYAYVALIAAILFVSIMFYYANNRKSKLILVILLWAGIHSGLAISGFYKNTMTTPPRMMLLVFPVVVLMMATPFSLKLKNLLATLDLKKLTYLHSVRIVAELTLYWLFLGKYVPELMTFQGRNFDILIGISAPIVAFLAFKNGKLNKPLLWAFNILSFISLLNIFANAMLSSPTIMQKFAFDQPNVALTHFPFMFIITIIVPFVMISNLAGFVILSRTK